MSDELTAPGKVQQRDRMHVAQDQGDVHGARQETAEENAAEDYAAILVHVTNPVATTTGATEFGAYVTETIPAAANGMPGQAQILPHDPRRQYAYLLPLDAAVVISTTLEAAQSANNIASASGASYNGAPIVATSPAANTVLATATLPGGTYTVNWGVILAGTVGAQDRNNVGLYVGPTLVATANNGINTGTNYGQLPASIIVPAGGAVVTLQTIGAGTASSVYSASFVAAPSDIGQSALATPSGAVLPQGTWSPAIRHNEPVYAANPTTAPVRVVALVERGNTSG